MILGIGSYTYGWASGTYGPELTREQDRLTAAGLIAVFYGIFCWFCLPKTPPAGGDNKKFALGEALALLRDRMSDRTGPRRHAASRHVSSRQSCRTTPALTSAH